MDKIVIVIHVAEEGGYWAEFPELPGCYTQGESIEEVLDDAPKAVKSHIEALREFGDPVPHEKLLVATIELSTSTAA